MEEKMNGKLLKHKNKKRHIKDLDEEKKKNKAFKRKKRNLQEIELDEMEHEYTDKYIQKTQKFL